MKNGLLRIIVILLSIVLLGAFVAGCQERHNIDNEGQQKRVVTDMSGCRVELPEKVERYAVAWAAISDITTMFDGVEHLVAYPEKSTSFSMYLEKYPNLQDKICLPNEGISVETILSSGAQVVFLKGSDDPVLVEQLRACEIAVVDCEFKDYEGLKDVVLLVAEVFGTEEDEDIAKQYCEYLEREVSNAKSFSDTLPESEKKTVLVIKDTTDYSAYGKTRYTGQWAEMCGGIYSMVNTDLYANVNLTKEQLLEYDPDILFFSMPGQAELFLNDDTWREMSAVKSGNVFNIPSCLNTWSNSGAESALIFEWACAMMYPDKVDYDCYSKISEYYTQFYNFDLTTEDIDEILNPKR